ncbi:glycosyltransferase family 4 protein [Pedobacter nototheniae]|uniref:glycosyltransferase family 4 protein n=1 Tax=Pedobacter nototheniae TaxID=2488994 RepID=UPI0010389BB7|nr:glycosyltransferase family 4 protein [Pedobacter nototheniae]
MEPKILFLTLNTFSLTGGIEQVCKTFAKTLSDIKAEEKIKSFSILSMYDDEADLKYIEANSFKGYKGKQISFGLAAVKQGLNANTLILSHIHLLVFARILKKLNPKIRIILLAHGIEIWNNLSTWKKDLLNKIEIWSVSNYTANQLINKINISPKNIHVLNNSLDPFFDQPKEKVKPQLLLKKYNINETQKVILTVCRLSFSEQYKGYDLVIQSLKDLIKAYPNLLYIMVGKADIAEQDRIDSLIKLCKLEKNVICTGFISDDDLISHYQLADIFIMPSKSEGFGLVYLEAAAYGCSVIAGNKDGSTDALLNGKIGQMVDPENTDAIYQAMLYSLSNPLTLQQIKAQQLLTQQHFSYQKYKKNIVKLLQHN